MLQDELGEYRRTCYYSLWFNLITYGLLLARIGVAIAGLVEKIKLKKQCIYEAKDIFSMETSYKFVTPAVALNIT